MKKFLASLPVIACLSLFLMVPVYAEHTTGNGLNANGTLTNNGNTMYDRTIGTRTGTGMGTGIGTGTTNGTTAGTNNYGTYDTNRMNAYNTNGNRVGTNNYRANAAADNDFDWGWLGLLGLIGLAGMRGKNRDVAR